MKHIFFGPQGRLRNGWWVLVFIAVFLLSRLLYTPVSQGLQALGLSETWLAPLPFVFALLVTWVCTRLRRQPLASVGFQMDRRWLREAVAGTAFGMASILVVTALVWATGGVRFELDPARSLAMLASGFYLFAFVALFEETLFRGFVFQRLVDGLGAWIALAGLGLLFAVAHWSNPGMEGATRFLAAGSMATGGIMFGLAWLRTRSLALPVGIHLGWNWTQGHVLGFGVSGFDHNGWLQPLFQGRPQWLTGGEFGPEASVFAVVIDVIAIALLWKWKGTVGASADTQVAPSAAALASTDQAQAALPHRT